MSDPLAPAPHKSAPQTATPQRPAIDAARLRHRRHVNIAAALAVVALLGLMVWVVQMISEQQRLERCFAIGRRDCAPIVAPPREAPLTPLPR